MMATAIRPSGSSAAQLRELLTRGVKFLVKGKPSNALRAFEEALAIDPGNADLHHHRANALADLGQNMAAIDGYDRAIVLSPRLAEAHDFRGAALARIGQFDQALISVERALAIAPDNLSALNNRANLLRDLGHLEEAVKAFDTVIQREPRNPLAYKMKAHTLIALRRYEEAIVAFERVVDLDPSDAEARCNIGTALLHLGRVDAGVGAFRATLAVDPAHVECLANLATVLAGQKQVEEAEALFRRCLALHPGYIEAELGLGLLLTLQRRSDEGGRCLQNVLKKDLNNVPALHGLADAMAEFALYDSVIACLDHLLSFAPNDALAHRKRGQTLMSMRRHAEAVAAFDQAAALSPNMELASNRLFAGMQLGQWHDFADRLEGVRRAVEARNPNATPFPILSFVDDPELHARAARNLGDLVTGSTKPAAILRRPARDKIRVGYFSADFFNHATMHLLVETLEQHDRDRFEFTAFSFGSSRQDAWVARARASFDAFENVQLGEDRAVAKRARDLEIDIAVDLKGYTQNGRIGIFAERAAPIQVGYLGYPGTSGADFIDYFVADEIVIPPESRDSFSEKIVYVPGSYQPNRSLHPLLMRATRQSQGLPEDRFVFCCFNQSYKITPSVFDVWMKVLRAVGDSVLWLWVDHEEARSNFSREAEARGVDRSRLIFASGTPLDEHLDRMRLADLFLDTFPYNAHTSGSDALRAGVPILTCAGRSFASRVGASLLTALNVCDLIVEDFDAYQALAIALATDTARLANIRAQLDVNRTHSTLFDPHHAARKLEAAYAEMYRRYHAGDPPEDIHIAF
ncbi:MAG: putative O-linked N-acetylglucosamine transferase (SPINDLY family) [Sphingomonas echinoides]|jgi:predicted O-linked N-acetylglucosamine transferase (SPINDLY family)|uniref:tetratricopeptide repeat protein n=2 Tax=Sphingomonas TaxID=13687 RepID=UPI001AEABDFE